MKRHITTGLLAALVLLASAQALAFGRCPSATSCKGATEIRPSASVTNSFVVNNSAGTKMITCTLAGGCTFGGDLTFSEDVSLADAAADKVTFGSGYMTKLRLGTGGTPGITLGDDDAYIEGTLEVDAEFQADGVADFNGNVDFAEDAVFSGSSKTISFASVLDLNASGATTIAGDIIADAAISGGFDIGMAQAADGVASVSIDVTSGVGGNGSAAIAGAGGGVNIVAGTAGTTDTDQDGADGGSIAITAGAGQDLNGAGSNDGSGGNITLTPGASSETGTGTEGAIVLNDDVRITDLAIGASANQACNTTCATKSCWFGLDNGGGTSALVACDSALADTCVCVGN